MNLSPIDRLKRARINLLMDEPFFGSLLMQLNIVERRNIPTFRTDGAQLQFNPAYLDKLDDTQLRTVLAHEVMHCALLHPFRVGHRPLKLANRAADYAVNNFLDHYNQQTPGTPPFKWPQDDAGKPDVLIDHAYDNMSFEDIYAALDRKNPPPPQPDQVQGEGNRLGRGARVRGAHHPTLPDPWSTPLAGHSHYEPWPGRTVDLPDDFSLP